jgi:glycosyltransferase involved in cell wall biosynthesis
MIEQYRLQGAVRLVNAASEDTLCASYAHAVALLYPSEYEGFGLPVIEAMACGTLVATSCVSSLPEVGGDVALYFDPGNVQSMIECLSQIAHLSQDQRRDRISNGVARARMFTWERCQQQTVDAFRRLM